MTVPRRLSPWRIVVGLLLLLALAGAGLCAAVLAVGLRLAAPANTAVGPPPADLPGAEAVQIPSASGSLLHGWWVAGTAPGGGAVVLMHGVWSNRRSMAQRARALHEQGFSVLLFDLQAHGESTGRHITFGRLEGLDAAAAVAFVRQRLPGERVGAIGVSLGGAAALLGPGPLPVDALVLESVYPDIDAALANRLRAGLGPMAGPLLTPLLASAFKLLLPPILGVRPDELRPIDHIGAVTAPLLVASGTADDRTPLGEARSLFERAPEPKRFWAVQGAAHVDLERHDPGAYWAVVLPFLTRHLRGGSAASLGCLAPAPAPVPVPVSPPLPNRPRFCDKTPTPRSRSCPMPTRTVKLTDRLNAYIEEAVASGRYVDASDVVREGLRLLALREWEDGTAPAAAPLPAGATAPRQAA